MDGELKYVHVLWIPAIPAGMTGFETLVYNDEGYYQGVHEPEAPASKHWKTDLPNY
jgi:hypothetical protein